MHYNNICYVVSTHSRLKAAGTAAFKANPGFLVSTHSRLKAAGKVVAKFVVVFGFQHTAA